MEKTSEQELRELASQLSHPKGESGIATAKSMNFTNDNMIRKTIATVAISDNFSILEIGPGNGTHIKYLFEKNDSVVYTGIDISETMISEANVLNVAYTSAKKARFELSNGETIEKPNATFDAVFTVNTLYFWKKPMEYLEEIHRVLKNGGQFILAFIPESTMKKIPFTKYGFELYQNENVCDLLQKADFSIVEVLSYEEEVKSSSGATLIRNFTIIKALKP